RHSYLSLFSTRRSSDLPWAFFGFSHDIAPANARNQSESGNLAPWLGRAQNCCSSISAILGPFDQAPAHRVDHDEADSLERPEDGDRKSTRLNSSHGSIS